MVVGQAGFWTSRVDRLGFGRIANGGKQVANRTPIDVAMELNDQFGSPRSEQFAHAGENFQLHSLNIDFDAPNGSVIAAELGPEGIERNRGNGFAGFGGFDSRVRHTSDPRDFERGRTGLVTEG